MIYNNFLDLKETFIDTRLHSTVEIQCGVDMKSTVATDY